jgi:hypothetical protein
VFSRDNYVSLVCQTHGIRYRARGRLVQLDLRRYETINERIVQTFYCVEITEKGIDLEKEGLAGPSSTWTYLVSDNPFGDVIQRLLRGLKRRLAEDVGD